MRDVFLTTSDNPYDPFKQFDDWYAFDTQKGYNTCAYLGRLIDLSHELSDQDQDKTIETLIDEAVELNLTGNYVKFVGEVEEEYVQ